MPENNKKLRTSSTGKWWRWSRYTVLDGNIAPHARGKLASYDPWDRTGWGRLGEEKSSRHTRFAPYHTLTRVVRDIPTDWPFDRPVKRTPVLHAEVLTWCRLYGLLGILPHTTLLASLDPWVVSRSPNGWTTWRQDWEPDEEMTQFTIDTGYGAAAWLESDESGWWNFFPTVNRFMAARSFSEFDFVPLTENFWRYYCEPFDEFIAAARLLANAVRVLSDPSHIPVVEYKNETLDIDAALKRLNELAFGVTPFVEVRRDGRFEQSWESPSLLGHLAMQAIQDLLGEVKMLTCKCGVTFSTVHNRKKYCGKTCADRYRKQDSRNKERAQPPKRSRQRR